MPSKPRQPWLQMEQVADVTVVRFTQPNILEEGKIHQIGKQLADLVETTDCRKFLLNFANIHSMSSNFVGKLVGMDRAVREAGGRLALSSMRPDIHEVFKILKLARHFTVYDTEEEALRNF
jgi:anti-anti-sigma factor